MTPDEQRTDTEVRDSSGEPAVRSEGDESSNTQVEQPQQTTEHEVAGESSQSVPTARSVDPDSDTTWRSEASKADGRRRRRQGLLVIGVALASAATGILVGTQIKSPADEAAGRLPPPASRITVPVERRVLSSSLVLSGEVRYNEPTPIRLGGSVGVEEGETQVITAVPEIGQTINEGDLLFEVTSRPVFVLQGELPMYRRLSTGSQGPDVLQLETALERLGFAPGEVDNVFDEATAAAVSEFYTQSGYETEGPSRAQRDELRVARQSVTDAETALRSAREALERDKGTLPESQLLQLRQAVTAAEAAVPAAEGSAARSRQNAAIEVTTATVSRDSARTIRDSAKTIRTAAPGSIDPATGELYTAERIAELEAEFAVAEENLALAEQALTAAVNNEQAVSVQVDAEIRAARDNLELARLQLNEATTPVDTSAEQAAVGQAQSNLDAANADLLQLEASVGVRVSPGELLFVPITPTNVTELYAVPGSAPTDQLGTLSTSETLVASRVSRGDSSLVTVGAPVTIELRDLAFETTGTVVSIGQPREDPNDPNAGSGGSTRLEVLIAPDQPGELSDYVFYGARVTIDIASTDGAVLTVPVAALTVGPDGSSRVEVETTPITEDGPGTTSLVEVEVGLTAQGLVEVRSDELIEGDQVVIGTETGERRNEDDSGDSGAGG